MKSEHVRSGPAASLAAELEAFATDRDSHGKHARAQGARAAAAALLRGETVTFERVTYRPEGYADRGSVFEGPREVVLSTLDACGEGWLHQGKEELARAAAAALADVEAGAATVRVGFLTYRVTSASV